MLANVYQASLGEWLPGCQKNRCLTPCIHRNGAQSTTFPHPSQGAREAAVNPDILAGDVARPI